MNEVPAFTGFKPDAFKFLSDLSKDRNNNKEWFAKNRERYDNNLVLQAKSFITSIGQFFNHLNPSIRTEPKFNETIMRINRDMRFAKGGPYRGSLLIHFGRFKSDSEFFVYLDKNGIEYGLFLNNTHEDEGLYFKQNLLTRSSEIIACCERFKINNRYDLYELRKEKDAIYRKFKVNKCITELSKMKYIIIKKDISIEKKLCFSPDIVTEAIRTFSNLYPLYCFSSSPEPMRLVEDFDDRMGVAV